MINYEPVEFVKLTCSNDKAMKICLKHWTLKGEPCVMVAYAIKEYNVDVNKVISVEEISLDEYRKIILENHDPSLN